MSHSIPTELANARIAASSAWDKYDAALGTPFQPELWKVVNWLEERATALYNEWQQQGGTSDIEVLSFANDPRNESRIDAELGQHTIISGGEVLELSSAQPADNDNIPF